MILLVVLLSIFVYMFLGSLSYLFCVKHGIGVTTYYSHSPDVAGAVAIGVFWIFTMPVILTYFLAKKVWEEMEKGEVK